MLILVECNKFATIDHTAARTAVGKNFCLMVEAQPLWSGRRRKHRVISKSHCAIEALIKKRHRLAFNTQCGALKNQVIAINKEATRGRSNRYGQKHQNLAAKTVQHKNVYRPDQKCENVNDHH
ncbi:MAG: hypothetical protein ACD_39C00176G0001 [uncultured bacterium]|nr:MAG: hypothetical protein ACD_39C00176G0001 [uncultured bacterium]